MTTSKTTLPSTCKYLRPTTDFAHIHLCRSGPLPGLSRGLCLAESDADVVFCVPAEKGKGLDCFPEAGACAGLSRGGAGLGAGAQGGCRVTPEPLLQGPVTAPSHTGCREIPSAAAAGGSQAHVRVRSPPRAIGVLGIPLGLPHSQATVCRAVRAEPHSREEWMRG